MYWLRQRLALAWFFQTNAATERAPGEADRSCFGFLGPSFDIGVGAGTKPHPDHDGQVQGLVGVAVAAAVQPVPADLAGAGGDGRDPAQVAKAASPRSRSGCWPAVTSSWSAWWLPIAGSPRSRGAARPTSLASRWSASWISTSSS
jgi:hypothetical protein